MKERQIKTNITARKLAKLLAAGGKVNIVDVSTPRQYRQTHVLGAKNYPVNSEDLLMLLSLRKHERRTPLYIICDGGMRSEQICERFPHATLVHVEGGTRTWMNQGLPVEGDSGELHEADESLLEYPGSPGF